MVFYHFFGRITCDMLVDFDRVPCSAAVERPGSKANNTETIKTKMLTVSKKFIVNIHYYHAITRRVTDTQLVRTGHELDKETLLMLN